MGGAVRDSSQNRTRYVAATGSPCFPFLRGGQSTQLESLTTPMNMYFEVQADISSPSNEEPGRKPADSRVAIEPSSAILIAIQPLLSVISLS